MSINYSDMAFPKSGKKKKSENPQKKHFKQSKGHLLLMRPVKRRLLHKTNRRASYPVWGRTESNIRRKWVKSRPMH